MTEEDLVDLDDVQLPTESDLIFSVPLHSLLLEEEDMGLYIISEADFQNDGRGYRYSGKRDK